jgi:hypothetical protein
MHNFRKSERRIFKRTGSTGVIDLIPHAKLIFPRTLFTQPEGRRTASATGKTARMAH